MACVISCARTADSSEFNQSSLQFWWCFCCLFFRFFSVMICRQMFECSSIFDFIKALSIFIGHGSRFCSGHGFRFCSGHFFSFFIKSITLGVIFVGRGDETT